MVVEILKTKEECNHVQFLITEASGPGKVQNAEIDEIQTLSLGKSLLKFVPTFLCLYMYNLS